MLDETGGWKAANTSLRREHLHAPTMTGRLAAARRAVELGYGIDADAGLSGRLGHWRIAGIPDEILEMHSKRAAEITAAVEARGDETYQARNVAARATRSAKHHQAEGELVTRWQDELAAASWPTNRLLASVEAASGHRIARLQSRKEARRVLARVLDDDGDMARRKVFSRRHLIVELAPHLYGWDPRTLEVLADRVVADPAVVPFIGTAYAFEPVYSLASVLAREGAIADSLAHHLDRTDAPTCDPDGLAEAVGNVEAEIGGQLSAKQRLAVEQICGSGRGAELVVGVSGAGKTTMLAAVAAAFEASGCQVVGTATAGQAARTLGAGAHLDRSVTLASFTGSLDRGRAVLGERSVVILDEAGMTDDLDLARLLAHVQLSGAKLVMVGGHRQLGAVGPGGAMAALVGRHPDAVHSLVGNRRQADPEERQALDQLRDGDIQAAVAWYAAHGRVRAVPDRGQALQAAVDAWGADLMRGVDTVLLAWRRANVAELNSQARDWMGAHGRLTGPELTAEDGVAYRAGDQIVALAPDHQAGLVTSQRATVTHVDIETATITVDTDDGRRVALPGEHLGADRVGYGYATTVHRTQGATVDRAHLYADGGGRELAYVAMSRARDTSTAWVVADDVDQAADDLTRDWATRKTPTWALDTGMPRLDNATRDDVIALSEANRDRMVAIAHARSQKTLKAAAGTPPPAPNVALNQAVMALAGPRSALADLATGAGTYQHARIGYAAERTRTAAAELRHLNWISEHAQPRRDRRHAARDIPAATAVADTAALHLQALIEPETARLHQQIASLEDTVGRLQHDHQRAQARWDQLADLRAAASGEARSLSRHLARARDSIDQNRPSRTNAPERSSRTDHARYLAPKPEPGQVSTPEL